MNGMLRHSYWTRQPIKIDIARRVLLPLGQLNSANYGVATKNGKAENWDRPVDQVFQVKSATEHVLLRPDAYIGPTAPAKQLAWIVQPDATNRMSERELFYSPGLYRICDEIFVNAADNWQRDPLGTTEIRISVDPTDGSIEVWNNGRSLPVALHPGVSGRLYVPSLLFGQLLSSSNFDDSIKASTGGRNGFGAKLCNIYSREFTVELRSGDTGQRFCQTWRHNMTAVGEPEVSASSGPDFTRVAFKPDLARFGAASLDPDIVALLQRRAYDLAATCPGLRVHFNGQQVPVTSFLQYCGMYAPPGALLASASNQRWLVAACTTVDPTASGSSEGSGAADGPGFRHVSFVNAIATPAGGRHVDLLRERLMRPLAEAVDKSMRNFAAVGKRGLRMIDTWPTVNLHQVRRRLWLFCSCRIDNPSFESQAKQRLTLPLSEFGPAGTVPDRLNKGGGFVDELANVNRRGSVGWAVYNSMVAAATKSSLNSSGKSGLASSAARKLSLSDVAAQTGDGVEAAAATAAGKLQHANIVAAKLSGGAGGGRRSGGGRPSEGGGSDCILVLTEGDSGKALAVAGAAGVPGGRDRFGVLALQGKLLNTREAAPNTLAQSRLLRLLRDTVGLQLNKRYETEADIASLHYRRLLIMADQDMDGTHIRGLVLNLLHCFWPELLLSKWDFLRLLVTPVAKAIPPADVKNGSLEFYNTDALAQWIAQTPDWRRYTVKFYKGLGGYTAAEGRQFFVRLLNGQSVRLIRREAGEGGEQDDEALMLAFGPDADARKAWLAERASAAADASNGELPSSSASPDSAELTCSEFIHRELVQFSLASNRRSIPALIDGLKPSQRKVLYVCLRRRQRQPIRLPQLAGSVAELTAYRHGDAALFNTIVGMAQDFPGSNNVNLLLPGGQFGSRLLGGKDAAAARYISTCLSPLARLIFHPDDDPLLTYQLEDGEQVEPVWYSPVVPLVVVNGADGIGTGWNTSIPNHSLADVIANLRQMLQAGPGQTAEPFRMLPAFRGHAGRIVPKGDGRRYVSYGRLLAYGDSGIFEIDELPVRVWSEPYGCLLADLAESVNNYCSDRRVRFIVQLSPIQLLEAKRVGLYRYFRLSNSFSIGSMVLADLDGRMRKHETVEDIMREYFDQRLDMYRRRLSYQLGALDASVRLLSNQARFALDVAEGRLKLSSLASQADANQLLAAAGFDPDPVRAWRACVQNGRGAGGDDDDANNDADEFAYLLRLPVWSLTLERRQRLLQDRDETASRMSRLAELTPQQAWLNDLDALEARAAALAREEARQLRDADEEADESLNQSQPSSKKERVKPLSGQGQAVIKVPLGLKPTLVPPPCDEFTADSSTDSDE